MVDLVAQQGIVGPHRLPVVLRNGWVIVVDTLLRQHQARGIRPGILVRCSLYLLVHFDTFTGGQVLILVFEAVCLWGEVPVKLDVTGLTTNLQFELGPTTFLCLLSIRIVVNLWTAFHGLHDFVGVFSDL